MLARITIESDGKIIATADELSRPVVEGTRQQWLSMINEMQEYCYYEASDRLAFCPANRYQPALIYSPRSTHGEGIIVDDVDATAAWLLGEIERLIEGVEGEP